MKSINKYRFLYVNWEMLKSANSNKYSAGCKYACKNFFTLNLNIRVERKYFSHFSEKTDDQ